MSFLVRFGLIRKLDLFGGRRQLILYHFMFAPSVQAGRRQDVPVAQW